MKKLSSKSRLNDQHGFILVFLLVAVIVIFVWGMLVIKAEQNYTVRTQLNVEILSSLNAASNAGPESQRMFEVGCLHLGRFINMASGGSVDNCNSTGFVPPSIGVPVEKNYNSVEFLDGSVICSNLNFRYDPGTINEVTITQSELCIDLTGCAQQAGMLLPVVSTEPYLFGASGCIGLKPPATMIMVDNSKKLTHTFQASTLEIPPPVFLHTDSGYDQLTSVEVGVMELNSLPMVFDYLPGYTPSFAGTNFSPYIYPFSTKEYTRSRSIRSQYGTAGPLPPFVGNGLAFRNSIPHVVPQTAMENGPADITITGPDPIQYMSGTRNSSIRTRTWAESASGNNKNYPWRHGVMTMNELANRCFNQRKLTTHRMAQQFMYMLEDQGKPFGALAYNNWIMGLMPYVPYHHRYNSTWLTNVSANPGSTLDIPVLGPDENLLGLVPPPLYFERQFGNAESSVTGGILDRETNFNLIFQPNTICAREMSHQVNPGSGPHVFTALPDPYNFNRRVTPDQTRCIDVNQHQQPTVEAIENYGIPFRGELHNVNDLNSNGTSFATGQFKAGDCFGDGFGAPGNPDWITTYESIPSSNPCGGGSNFGIPTWSRRDNTDILGEKNRDQVPVASITDPYRLCPASSEMNSTLDPANINVASVLSTLRAGSFTKSGWPLNIPGGDLISGLSRYFTAINDPNVYPAKETTVVGKSIFTVGGLINGYNILNDPRWVPDPSLVRRVVVLFSNGYTDLTMAEALTGIYHTAWFQDAPPAGLLPPNGPLVLPPFSKAIKELLQVIHRMAEEGFIVVVVNLEDENSDIAVSNERNFMSAGLRAPIGIGAPTDTTYAYALCKPCGGGPATQLPGEPAIEDPTTACGCVDGPTARNVHEIRMIRQSDEPWPNFQERMFRRVSIQLNRIMNQFVLTK